ncbi:MAG: hypothetical protein V5A23_02775 [Halobacteriales archaeon]
MSALNPSRIGSDDEGAAEASASALHRILPAAKASLRAGAFWLAVALPFLYVPLLATGVSTAGQRGALAVLLVVNVFALYAGHGYRPG